MAKKIRRSEKPRRKKNTVINRKHLSLDKLLTSVRSEPDNLEATVALCEYYLFNSLEQKIAEVLDNFNISRTPSDENIIRKFNLLQALGFAHSRRFGEADKVAHSILATDPQNLDALFVIAYTHLSLREFEKASEISRKYIDAFADEHAVTFCGTDSHKSQVWNFLGSSLQEIDQVEQAIEAYNQAIKSDTGNHLPYLNIAALFSRANEIEKARGIVEKGITCCRQVEELRLVEKSLNRTASISACLIVKNEEELLPECLASVRDWVDEIIVIDTGSTDSTIEIAESYGAKVLTQAWEGDFSKHRNYSLDQATSDWLFVIDADERIRQEDVGVILQQVNDNDNTILAISVLNVGGKHNEEITSLSSVRFFKRNLHLRYEGIVHNQLAVDPTLPVKKIPVSLIHLGYGLSAEKMAAKAQRTIGLLEKQLNDNPANSFAWYNLAQVLMGMDFVRHPENPNRIINAAEQVIKLTTPDSDQRGERNIHLMSLQQLALIHFIGGNLEKTVGYAEQALEINPNYLDTLLLLGNVLLRQSDYESAENYYLMYLSQQKEQELHPLADDLILLHPRSRYRAQYGLGVIAHSKGDNAGALKYFEESQETTPEYLDTSARIGCIYLESDQIDQAAAAFHKQLEFDSTNRMALIGSCCVSLYSGNNEGIDAIATQAIQSDHISVSELIVYAKMFDRAGAKDLTVRCLDRLRAQKQIPADKLSTAAGLYLSSGLADKAAAVYKEVMDGQGESSDILNDLAGCFYKSEDYQRAEEFYVKAIESEEVNSISYRNLGLTRARLDKPKEAIIALQQYIELVGEDNDIKHLLGDLQRKTGELTSAIQTFEGLLDVNPNDALTLFKLSECYHVMGHRDSAIMGYRRVLQSEPDFQPAHQRLAELLQPVEQP